MDRYNLFYSKILNCERKFLMEVNNIRSILSNKFHEAQAIMNKKEKVLNIVSQGIKATASTPWAKNTKRY